MIDAFRSLEDIENRFPDRESCLDYLERLRWNGVILSPFTGSTAVYKVTRHVYHCRDTGKRFSATTNTIFSDAKITLQDWLKLIWLHSWNPGLSSVEVAKRTGLNQRTVWGKQQKIKLIAGMGHKQG